MPHTALNAKIREDDHSTGGPLGYRDAVPRLLNHCQECADDAGKLLLINHVLGGNTVVEEGVLHEAREGDIAQQVIQ
jgi:hypothetical protein